MHINHLHDWNLPPRDAIALQTELAAQLIDDQPLDLHRVQLVAGVDVSVRKGVAQAAVVVMRFDDLQPVEVVRASQPVSYPYVPGLLTFREGPVLVKAFERMQHEPDVFLFDGMGRIHPRRMGIAAHLGLWLDRPAIGCGKTHFIGTYDLPAASKGAATPLWHNGEQLGVVLRTRSGVKPVYVSVGHRAELTSAVALVMACTPRYRLPRPIRLAHRAAGEFDND